MKRFRKLQIEKVGNKLQLIGTVHQLVKNIVLGSIVFVTTLYAKAGIDMAIMLPPYESYIVLSIGLLFGILAGYVTSQSTGAYKTINIATLFGLVFGEMLFITVVAYYSLSIFHSILVWVEHGKK